MRGAVEKIGIAESHVRRARGDLLANIVEHDVALHHAKLALINRHDRTMAAQMFAAAAGFGVSDGLADAAVSEMGITHGFGQAGAIGQTEGEAIERNLEDGLGGNRPWKSLPPRPH